MYCYTIYTIDTWSVLAINSPTLMSIYQPYIRIEDNRLCLFLIFILNLKLEFSMMSYIIVINCHKDVTSSYMT